MSRPVASSRVARRGLFVTALLLGLGLIATAWTSFRGADALAETVSQGQAERLLEDLRDRLALGRGPLSGATFAAFHADHAGEGLRAVAVVDCGGVREAVGTLAPDPLSPEDLGPGRTFRRVGDRLRVIVPMPAPGGRPDPQQPPGTAPPRVVLEFEPILAGELHARSTRSLAFGLGAAVVLVAAAGIFWQRAQRADALAARLAESERLASLGTMSAVLAHEIKNPLAALKGHAQLLVEVLPEGARPRAQADRVVAAAVRLQGLVDNLLDFARSGPIERAPHDPAEMLRVAAADAAPEAALDLEAAPASWSLDGVRMRQVLENLLRNAAQASPEGVTARVRVEEEQLVFAVCDEGPGFAAGDAEKIFEPFHTTKTRGVGLGLTVARRVVEMHGGAIVARNRPEGGAELRVSIPRG